MDIDTLPHLVQAGAVGISIALIFLIYKISEYCNKNGEKIVEVVEKNAIAMTQLTDSIDKNSEATEKMADSMKNISYVARDAMNMKQKRVKKI